MRMKQRENSSLKYKMLITVLSLLFVLTFMESAFAATTNYNITPVEITQGETSVMTSGSTTGGFTQSDIVIPLLGTKIKAGNNEISVGSFTPTDQGTLTWNLANIPTDAAAGTYEFTWTQTAGNGDIVYTKITLVIKSAAPPVVAPSVSTGSYSGVTSNSATVSGNVTDDGGESVTYGIAYSTSSNPTTGTTVGFGTGARSFSGSLTGLLANTTYYYRAFASNSAGVTYGNQGSFTTLPSPPTVTINNATGITSTQATVSANASGLSISAKGFSHGLDYN